MESARSKIVVGVVLAAVGAVVSTLAGWIPNPLESTVAGSGPTSEPEDVFLVIEGVDVFGRGVSDAVQVIATVNGATFQYPSRAGVEWAEVGPSMSSQRFQLPRGMDRADLTFELRTSSGKVLVSQENVLVVLPTGVPHEGTYNLHEREGLTRAAPISAAVRYRLEAGP